MAAGGRHLRRGEGARPRGGSVTAGGRGGHPEEGELGSRPPQRRVGGRVTWLHVMSWLLGASPTRAHSLLRKAGTPVLAAGDGGGGGADGCCFIVAPNPPGRTARMRTCRRRRRRMRTGTHTLPAQEVSLHPHSRA